MAKIGYNEYKFHVGNDDLKLIRTLLDSFYGGTDPFPEGVVDSIYYDSLDRKAYRQCLDGDAMKRKFRIRGYGDGRFNQIHLKEKDLFGVGKLKSKIAPVATTEHVAPAWDELKPLVAMDPVFTRIMSEAESWGPLMPSVRVRYHRYRYRINDYRMTLDTKIEVISFVNGIACVRDYALLRDHVLEIKTADPRPHIPLMGLARLHQISFSKFFLGLNSLMQMSA